MQISLKENKLQMSMHCFSLFFVVVVVVFFYKGTRSIYKSNETESCVLKDD